MFLGFTRSWKASGEGLTFLFLYLYLNTVATPNKFKKIFGNLTFYVLIALLLAVFVGHFFPALAIKAEPLGTGFVSLIKLFIPPIIFLTIVSGISGMQNLKKVGRIGIKSLLYFEIVTTLSL